jgi:hypothetical protein
MIILLKSNGQINAKYHKLKLLQSIETNAYLKDSIFLKPIKNILK